MNVLARTAAVEDGPIAEPRTAVGNHTHLVRNKKVDDAQSQANLIAWARKHHLGACGLGSPWTAADRDRCRVCEHEDRDRYYAGELDQAALLDRAGVEGMLREVNAAAGGKTFFYVDNETPKCRYGHLWYAGYEMQVPAWHDYNQDRRESYSDLDPVADRNTITGKAHIRRSYAEVIGRQRKAGALAVWAHPTSWWTDHDRFYTNIASEMIPELLMDGFLDGMTVQGYDPYHREYQRLWFALLDRGYRINGFSELDMSPGYGTNTKDSALFNYIPGIAGAPTLDQIKAAFRNGRHTMSSGPDLRMTVHGLATGETFAATAGSVYTVIVQARPAPGEKTLSRVELLGRGGQVLNVVKDFPGGQITFTVADDGAGGYLIARAFGEKDGDYATQSQQKIHHCAITNPVWLESATFRPPAPVRTQLTIHPGQSSGVKFRLVSAAGDPLEQGPVGSSPVLLEVSGTSRLYLDYTDGHSREFPLSMANARVRTLMDYLADGIFRSDYPESVPGVVPLAAFNLDAFRAALLKQTIVA